MFALTSIRVQRRPPHALAPGKWRTRKLEIQIDVRRYRDLAKGPAEEPRSVHPITATTFKHPCTVLLVRVDCSSPASPAAGIADRK
jgi:hypothetical protein